MFSGCQDAQCSADVQDVSSFGLPDANGAGGACTNALLLTLADAQPDSWLGLLKGMREVLADKGVEQVPQLSTSRPIDVTDPFSLLHTEPSGISKALLIGINYIGQQGELSGCHNDVAAMHEYIAENGYPSPEGEGVMIIMDDDIHTAPTRDNLIEGFRWLVADAAPGDSLFMHYSGHGGSQRDENGDEEDRMDETMVPVDYTEAGQIKDDEILKELVMALPEGVQLTVLMDCSHSGSILDLPYSIKANEETLSAVESGEMSTLTSLNDNFNMGKMMSVGSGLSGSTFGGFGGETAGYDAEQAEVIVEGAGEEEPVLATAGVEIAAEEVVVEEEEVVEEEVGAFGFEAVQVSTELEATELGLTEEVQEEYVEEEFVEEPAEFEYGEDE
ncbi:unnamed protein product [Choristocarpus tenellus]